MARPGSASRKPKAAGKFADSREAWVQVNALELVNHVGSDEDSTYVIEAEGAELHQLAFRFRGRSRPVYINLTSMTAEELDMLQLFINRAIDMARPSVLAIDAHAKQAFEEGDDSYARVYRAVPRLFVRKGEVSQHGQGLPSGPDGTTADATPSGGPPDAGGESGSLPDSTPHGVGSCDDQP